MQQRHDRAQKRLVVGGEIRHVGAGLSAAQARQQRDRRHLDKVVARRVACPWILAPLIDRRNLSIACLFALPVAAVAAAFGE